MEHFPDFIIVGAPKAGTTSMAKYLGEHPQVHMAAEKEPFFFIPQAVNAITKDDPMLPVIRKKAHLREKEYLDLFSDAGKGTLKGEATVHYLYHYEEAIPNILNCCGDIKIIIMLRNPIERAFSNYQYHKRLQKLSFEEALEIEQHRMTQGFNSFWYYQHLGLYYKPVRAYLESFSNVHIVFHEDFQSSQNRVMEELYSFLGVNPDIKLTESKRHNETRVPKSKLIHNLVYLRRNIPFFAALTNNPRIVNSLKKILYSKSTESIGSETRKELQTFFEPDIGALESLLNRSLRHWK